MKSREQLSIFNDETIKEIEVYDDTIIDVKFGDIFRVGEHLIMCGDSTNKEMVDKLINGNVVDLIFTDPPYGMKKEKDGVKNDNLNYDDLLDFNKQWIPLSFDVLKGNGSWYCWGIDEPLMDIYSSIIKPMIRNKQVTFRNLITWNKGSGQGQRTQLGRSYARADEKCLFVMKGIEGFDNNSYNFFEGFSSILEYLSSEVKKVNLNSSKCREITGKQNFAHWFSKSQWALIGEEDYNKIRDYFNNDILKKDYDILKKDYDIIREKYLKSRAFFDNVHDNFNNVWHFNPAPINERLVGHPTPKPLELCIRAIKSSTREGETVLDLFGGGGSTMVACEMIKRKCLMIELDEKFVSLILTRMKQTFGIDYERIKGC